MKAVHRLNTISISIEEIAEVVKKVKEERL